MTKSVQNQLPNVQTISSPYLCQCYSNYSLALISVELCPDLRPDGSQDEDLLVGKVGGGGGGDQHVFYLAATANMKY